MKFSVFLSHSSKDAALANELCRLLEANSITCWIAPRNIVSGTSYGEGGFVVILPQSKHELSAKSEAMMAV